jgi:hypothetical protein
MTALVSGSKAAGHSDLAVEHVGSEHLGGDLFFLDGLGELQLLHLVEELQNRSSGM